MPQTATARFDKKSSAQATEMTDASAEIRQRPANEIRLGAIKGTIWKNETSNGVRYNVTFSRLYKDGDQWKSTESFGRDDLLMLATVADQAHSWIYGQSQ